MNSYRYEKSQHALGHVGTLLLAVAALSACAASGPSRAPNSPQTITGFASQSAAVNGTTLFYQSAGEGSAVLLIHGYTQTGSSWQPLATELSKTHRVIVPDLRGIGESAVPENGVYTKKAAAADLHALLNSLQIGEADVVGHDIGLMVAYAYAAQWPKEVKHLIVMDAPLPGIEPWEQVKANPALWHFNFYGSMPEALVEGRERVYLNRFWDDFAATPGTVTETDRRANAEAYAKPGYMRAGFSHFGAFATDATDNQAFAQQKIDMPILAMGGEKSLGPLVGSQFALVGTRVTPLVVIGAGHWLLEEKPAEVIAAVKSFLNR